MTRWRWTMPRRRRCCAFWSVFFKEGRSSLGRGSLPRRDLETRLHLALLQAGRQPTGLLQVPSEALWTAELLALAREAMPPAKTTSPEDVLRWISTEIHAFLVDAGR